ncbi:hypothetical protein GDO78_013308 [Eleutherodactylus coqui]|uniref:Uncharacterized protein n=1 Tax=Eleutherodactylus coqui TaxID=57060 RepID=A0A8J6F0T1_ELECQ|nr:hypothetical protein GDO78_013308 [Eleutherodactylus coqui]
MWKRPESQKVVVPQAWYLNIIHTTPGSFAALPLVQFFLTGGLQALNFYLDNLYIHLLSREIFLPNVYQLFRRVFLLQPLTLGQLLSTSKGEKSRLQRNP